MVVYKCGIISMLEIISRKMFCDRSVKTENYLFFLKIAANGFTT